MADPGRTHKATPKRVREFRKRGEIALSRELVSAAALVGGVVALLVGSGPAIQSVLDLSRDAASASDGHAVLGLPGTALRTFLTATTPALIGAAIASVVVIMMQVGWPPAFKLPKFDLGKLSPAANLAQIGSLGQIVKRSGTALVKLAVVGAIVVLVLHNGIALTSLDAGGVAELAGASVRKLIWPVLMASVALGIGDYLLARRRIAARMRMTPDEVKREMRESEGDPMVRGKRKQRMRELAKRRMAANVAKADVVVVNPTHYAVALRYDSDTDRAPVVVAKGVDELAEKIREVARKHSVPVLSRPPLARALHKHVGEGKPIPANLYRAVAEVLAYVYRLRAGGNA